MGVETLSEWLDQQGIVPMDGAAPIADVPRVRALLIAAAREARSVSYAELLGDRGGTIRSPMCPASAPS